MYQEPEKDDLLHEENPTVETISQIDATQPITEIKESVAPIKPNLTKKQKMPTIGRSFLTFVANFFLIITMIGLAFNFFIVFSFIGIAVYYMVLTLFLIMTLFSTYKIILPLMAKSEGFTNFVSTISVAIPYVAWSTFGLSIVSLLIFIFKKNYAHRKSKIITAIILLVLSIIVLVGKYLIDKHVN